MAVPFKQKCARCKKNYVMAYGSQRYVYCYECQKGALNEEITDPAYKSLFDIPEEYYKESVFLRNIKAAYLKNKSLTMNQIAAFEKVVKQLKEGKG